MKQALMAWVLMTLAVVASAGQPAPSCSFGPPDAIRKVLNIRTPEGSGHGFATGLMEIYTAYHVVSDATEIHYRSPYDPTLAGMIQTWTGDKKDDVAVLVPGMPVSSVLEFAGKEPAVGEVLWFAGFQFTEDPFPGDNYYWGLYMGHDEKGHMVVDSNGFEGFSGGPLLNSAGKVVGIVVLFGHPNLLSQDFECDKADGQWSCMTQFLNFLTQHRSMVFAQPMWKRR